MYNKGDLVRVRDTVLEPDFEEDVKTHFGIVDFSSLAYPDGFNAYLKEFAGKVVVVMSSENDLDRTGLQFPLGPFVLFANITGIRGDLGYCFRAQDLETVFTV